ncbi:MAG: M50 family metallopeptidase [Chloroflexota bacterium]|nr:M50 family metallopeptidase [Chloroflexota bacterium]
MSILIFAVILVVLIMVHELGHFVAAKLTGVKVVELGLGFPPRIVGVKRGDTIYSLNAVPLGGFCKMAGEEDPSVPDSLAGKSRWARVFVLAAGSLAMFLLPLVLLPIAYAIPMERYVEGDGVQVVAVSAGSPAEEAGLEARDIVLAVDGVAVNSFDEMHQAIEPKAGTEVTLLVLRRPDTQFEVTLVPRVDPPEGQGSIGIQMISITEVIGYPPWRAIPMGFAEYGQMWVLMKDVVVELVRGAEMPSGWEGPPVTGPIGIAQLTGEIAIGGAMVLVLFACYLSVNLAIINLLPIPALDGGRIAFILLEVLRRGKRVSTHTEGLINTVGFAALIVLIVVVSYYDVLRIVHGGSMLP